MVYLIAKRVISLLIRPWLGKCTGIENVPKKEGAILAANHSSYLDHLIIGCNIVPKTNRHAKFLAKKEHFEAFFERQWHKYLQAIPIDRQAGGEEALKEAIKRLKKGSLIMVYPEGTRTLTGKMNKGKTGAVRLALAAKVPIIPMGITNTFKILPKGKRIPKLGLKADLNIGKPLYLDKYYGKDDDGTVYHAWYGYTDEGTSTTNGTAVTLQEEGRQEDFGQPLIPKSGGELELEASAAGSDYTITVYAKVGNGNYAELGTLDLVTESAPTLPVALPFTLSDEYLVRKKFHLDGLGSFRTLQIKLVNSDKNTEEIKIYGYNITTYPEEIQNE